MRILLVFLVLSLVGGARAQEVSPADTARFATPWGSEYLFFEGIDTLDNGYTSPALFYEVRNYAANEGMLTFVLSRWGVIDWYNIDTFLTSFGDSGGGPHVLVPLRDGKDDVFDNACLRLAAVRDTGYIADGRVGIFSDPLVVNWIGPVRRGLCRQENDWDTNFATGLAVDSWGAIKALVGSAAE